MPLPTPLLRRLGAAVGGTDGRGRGVERRLADDARRLWRRLSVWLEDEAMLGDGGDPDALELACWALQLPWGEGDPQRPVSGRLGTTSLRDRAAAAAEALVARLGGEVPADLLDRTVRLLHELPQRPPVLDDAKLLSDAVNLDDFGIGGLVQQAILLGRGGGGLEALAEATARRIDYGYWQARLKDDFYFEHPRQLAAERLGHLIECGRMLDREASDR